MIEPKPIDPESLAIFLRLARMSFFRMAYTGAQADVESSLGSYVNRLIEHKIIAPEHADAVSKVLESYSVPVLNLESEHSDIVTGLQQALGGLLPHSKHI